MRDLLGTKQLCRLLPAPLSVALALALLIALPALGSARESTGPQDAAPVASAAESKQRTAAQRRRAAQLRREAVKRPTLTLNSSFIRRAQAAGSVVPFTIRLRRPYEAGPGDDVLQLAFDDAATPWPLAGTAPGTTPSNSNLDGALSYEWDYGADTSGYSTLGTVETHIGGGVSLTGTGFPIAFPTDPSCIPAPPAAPTPALAATGVSFTAAGVRFGTINPFSGEVNGTINLRTQIRTRRTPCPGAAPTPDNALATTTASDRPLPVAFTGRFYVSPSVAADGRVRLGILRISDATTPQRTTFGLVHACTDPADVTDHCARRAFPVRTKFVSLTAEVLAGDAMPPAPAAP